jgi:hypothetical protein
MAIMGPEDRPARHAISVDVSDSPSVGHRQRRSSPRRALMVACGVVAAIFVAGPAVVVWHWSGGPASDGRRQGASPPRGLPVCRWIRAQGWGGSRACLAASHRRWARARSTRFTAPAPCCPVPCGQVRRDRDVGLLHVVEREDGGLDFGAQGIFANRGQRSTAVKPVSCARPDRVAWLSSNRQECGSGLNDVNALPTVSLRAVTMGRHRWQSRGQRIGTYTTRSM